MLHILPAPLCGVLMSVAFVGNLVFWAIPVYAVIIVKLVPLARLQRAATRWMHRLCEYWVRGNILISETLLRTDWDIEIDAVLAKDKQYLVIVNHQSWNDIYVLMRAFDGRIPFFKFFIKQELIWVPILGPVWWALDYPFMKRYSKAQIAANPELAGEDLETAKAACAKYRGLPVAVLNFLEGTRFTAAKQSAQKSPYRHLLKPKSGGLAFAISALGPELDSLLDVSIVYPTGAKGFWDFMCGRMQQVVVRIEQHPIPDEFFSKDYRDDPEFRERFQDWVGTLWTRKDDYLDAVKARGL